jgi:tripartite-type tricarboxylate transporter receptor subunit TctC
LQSKAVKFDISLIPRKKYLCRTWRLLVASLLFFGAPDAVAQNYPTKPVTIVVTTAAGGLTDLVARAIGQRLSQSWGQTVIIENKGGAGHGIGASSVAKAPPDGYTLMVTEGGTIVVNPNLYAKGKLFYDTEKDFVPISGLARYYLALVTNPSLPVRTIEDLIILAKNKPGEITYGTSGIGSATHMSMALFENMTGVKLVPVHYRGAAPAMNDLLGGHISVMWLSTALSLQPFRAGRIKMLGVGSLKRLSQAPDVPTVAESGLRGYESAAWIGLFAPSGLPPEIQIKISTDVQRILADPGFREKLLASQMLEPMTGSPEQFTEYIRLDMQKWLKIIRDQKISID